MLGGGYRLSRDNPKQFRIHETQGAAREMKNLLVSVESKSIFIVKHKDKPKRPPSNITFDPMKAITENRYVRTARTRK